MIVTTAPSRTPSAFWQGALTRAFGGPNHRLAWLELAWHPGWERWVIYQVVPPGATNFFVQLEPAAGAPMLHIDLEMLDRGQRALWERTGCFGSVLWVIQGRHGGHRRRWWPYEAALAQMSGLPKDLPDPGELCYAEMDTRVFEQLMMLDSVGKWNQMVEWCDRNPNEVDAEMDEARRMLKRKLGGWVQDQVSNVFADQPRRVIQDALDEMPHGITRTHSQSFEEWMETRVNQ